MIQKQIRFTRDYQTIGARPPRWQSLGAVVMRAIQDIDPGSVRMEKDLGNVEIYADYLFDKVFFNLVENSLRHGGNVTVCRFSFREKDSGAEIVYEDNGIGIPVDAKGKIFRREYYRITGYGLFLAQEILSITGMTIRRPGTGKRCLFRDPCPKRGIPSGKGRRRRLSPFIRKNLPENGGPAQTRPQMLFLRPLASRR